MADVLFVCVHNSGRSQMAEALFNHLAAEKGLTYSALSAGTAPGEQVNPLAAQVMEEIGITLGSSRPKLLTSEMAKESGQMITMGCGVDADACPAGTWFTEDWGLDDPAGQPIERVREIRDQVRHRVEALLERL